jgi:type II secretory pathway predicted ATPase ExeA
LPAQVETIYLATPSLAREEILHAIADELELKISQERMTVALRELQEQLIRLYAAGRRVVILVDEAHVMPEETLEQVRLLSNLESNRHKLLQIVLFGQPELDATLAKASLRQLRDRITHAFRMRPLSPAEVTNYVSFRMRAAGYRGPEVFSPRSSALIARASGGLTRRINILADKSLLAAFTENTHGVAERHVRAAVADSEFSVLAKPQRPALYVAAALATGIALGVGLHWMLAAAPPSPALPGPPATAPAAAPSPPPAAAAVPVRPERPPESSPPSPAPPAPAPSHLTASQVRRLAGYSGRGQPLLASRISATHDLLQRAPDERYAIELFVTDNTDPARMERFLQRAREVVPLAEVFVIPMAAGGQYRLRVVLGEFEDLEAARQAGRRLPPKYQQAFRAAPRSFGELRSQI